MPRNKESTADFMKRLKSAKNAINLEENREIPEAEELTKHNTLGNGLKNDVYMPILKKKKNVHKNNIVLII
jgi:hypothetical protein